MVVIFITFTTQQIASKIYFLAIYKDKNAKLHNFFAVPTVVETAMEVLPINNTSFQSQMKMLWKITD